MQIDFERLANSNQQARVRKIMFLVKHRIAYVPTPKAGCSSFKLWMDRMYVGDAKYFPDGSIHSVQQIPKPDHYGYDKLSTVLERGCYGFSFVRDPERRLISCYYSKLGKPRYKRAVNRVLGIKDEGADVDFDTFLTALEIQEEARMDAHWRPQTTLLMLDAIEYDRIGKLENAKEDFRLVQQEAGLPNMPLPHRNRGTRPEIEITPARRKRIEEIYAVDYETFSYG